MYYQNYEDYMRQVLGYPINDPNIYESYGYKNGLPYEEDTYLYTNQTRSNLSDDEINSYYPDIYHTIYPMVCKVCEATTEPINRDIIEKMTDEVYFSVEDTNTIVNIRANTPKPEENRTVNVQNNERKLSREENRNIKREINRTLRTENREIIPTPVVENRQRNSFLRDLIKILILNRIFGNRPNRPRPPRLPFPGGRPPMGPGMPPIQPRDYTNYL